jgi:hypothetical protein
MEAIPMVELAAPPAPLVERARAMVGSVRGRVPARKVRLHLPKVENQLQTATERV